MSYLLSIRCNKMSAFLTGKLTSTCISAHVLFIFHTPKCTFIEYDSWSVLQLFPSWYKKILFCLDISALYPCNPNTVSVSFSYVLLNICFLDWYTVCTYMQLSSGNAHKTFPRSQELPPPPTHQAQDSTLGTKETQKDQSIVAEKILNSLGGLAD